MWYLIAALAIAIIAIAVYAYIQSQNQLEEWKRKYKITDNPDVKASRHQ